MSADTTSAADIVDWDLAVATARRLVPRGPEVSRAEAYAAVAELRELAALAQEHVAEFTGMFDGTGGPDDEGPHDEGPDDGSARPLRPATVVDRVSWVKANVEGFQVIIEPLARKLAERRSDRSGGPLVNAVGRRITGAQLGAVLAYLSGKVLGQYEVFLPPGRSGAVPEGRLTLVAPNIVAAERALAADPRDFRLWVCLHEATHQAQFTAVPWLRGHVESEVTSFLVASDLDPAAVVGRMRAVADSVVEGVVDSLRRHRDADEQTAGGRSLIDAVQTPEQRAVFDRLQAIMTLLEGHGEYVMNGVGPQVVPSVEEISQRFAARRQGTGRLDRAIRRIFGLDIKARQYAEGAAFVRAVVDEVGMAGFNAVWTSPQTLPTGAELADPAAWVSRVRPVRG